MIRPRRRHVVASITAAAVIGGGTLAIAANPAPESYAFVARGDNPVDALAAAPLAGRLNAPVVLTEPGALTDAARDALRSADPDNVVIAGGPVAISPEVEAAIRDLLPGADVDRAQGGTRYDTGAALAGMFDDIAPSFLATDGKANAAEQADDASRFGGLAPDEYQFTQVNRQGEFEAFSYPGSDTVTRDILPPMTVDVPVDGVLDVEALAIDEEGNTDGFVVLVDYEGPVDTSSEAATLEVYDHMAAILPATSAGSGYDVPVRVGPGQHTVRFVALGSGDTTAQIGLRSLVVHYTAGVSGPWESFEGPPSSSGGGAGLESIVTE